MEGLDKLPSPCLFPVAVVVIFMLKIHFGGYSTQTDLEGQELLVMGKLNPECLLRLVLFTILFCK